MRNLSALLALIVLSFNLAGCGPRTGEETPALSAPDLAPEDICLEGLIEGESVRETHSARFTGEDSRIEFSNGAEFILTAEDNAGAEAGTFRINLLDEDRFFNDENDLVFDLSEAPADYTLRFAYPLPPGLDDEDISLNLYSPGTSVDELDNIAVQFTYNEETGGISASLPPRKAGASRSYLRDARLARAGRGRDVASAPAQHGHGDYSRLVLCWDLREALAETDRRKIILMPFYEQSGDTCWAACTKMMGRAYAAVNDRGREMRLYEIVRYMRHNDFETGVGIFAFRNYISSYLSRQTGVEFTVSTYFRTSRLRREVIRHLNNDRPLIMNLPYPGVGQHQILVTGYEVTQTGIGRATLNILYHNPQNTSGDIYRWSPFDRLMEDKGPHRVIQILHADRPVPDGRALQTLATPIFGKPITQGGQSVGEFAFESFEFRPADGRPTAVPIHPVYRREVMRSHGWVERDRSESSFLEVIPSTPRHIRLDQRLFNATAENQEVYFRITAADEDSRLYDNETIETLSPGNSSIEEIIPLQDFYHPEKEREILLMVRLRDRDARYLDGYTFKFTLAPKKTTEIGLQVSLRNIEIEEKQTNRARPEINRPERVTTRSSKASPLNISRIDLVGDGRTFEGQLTRQIGNNPGHTSTADVNMVLDDADDPNRIELLTVTLTGRRPAPTEATSTSRFVFRSIPIREEDKRVLGGMHFLTEVELTGGAVAGVLSNFERVGSSDEHETRLISHQCVPETALKITLFHDADGM